jgi:predicted nucleic acid-binding protein
MTEFARFRRFLARLTLPTLDDAIMERFARIRAGLRRQCQLIPIPDLDLLIATTAIHHELIQLTRNVRHFARIPALKLHQPNEVGSRRRAISPSSASLPMSN